MTMWVSFSIVFCLKKGLCSEKFDRGREKGGREREGGRRERKEGGRREREVREHEGREKRS